MASIESAFALEALHKQAGLRNLPVYRFNLAGYRARGNGEERLANALSLSSGRCGNLQRCLRSYIIDPFTHHLLSLEGIVPLAFNSCQAFSENSYA